MLTHFCYRNRPQPSVPPEIQGMTAQQRLESILWQGKLWGFTTFSGGVPAVCFTEATLNGLNFMIGRRFYRPWGLVFDRQSIYDAGGGPVWYARPDEYQFLRGLCESGQVDSRLQSWLVRLDGSSDWLEEREWALEEQRNGKWRYLEFLQVTSLITADIFMREIPGGTRARHRSRPVDLPEHRY